MTDLVPVSESVKIGENYYGRAISVNLCPYNNEESVKNALAYFNIELPFKVIDRGDGISECGNCGAKYAGYQSKCVKIGYYYYNTAYTYKEGYTQKADLLKKLNYYDSQRIKEKWMECGHNPTWSLKNEFSKQEIFFKDIVDLHEIAIAQYPDTNFTCSDKYRDILPPGMATHLEQKAMKLQIKKLTEQIEAHHGAIEEIIERIQASGSIMLNGAY